MTWLQVRPPEETLIQLPEGEWIVVKKWLNNGESQAINTRMVKAIKIGEPDGDGKATSPEMSYDFAQMAGMSQVIEYLLDWSAKDADGKPLVILNKSERQKELALRRIPPEAFKVVMAAVQDHEKQMQVEADASKNVQSTEPTSSAPSPSADI